MNTVFSRSTQKQKDTGPCLKICHVIRETFMLNNENKTNDEV